MQVVSQHSYPQSHQFGLRIDEVFPDNTISPGSTLTKEISFTNIGSAPLFLRISYVETWENGEEWLEDDGANCTKNWTSAFASEWDFKDGWYYYKKVLPAGVNTGNILESISFPSELPKEYLEGAYSLDFMVEALQLSNEADVNTQATQEIFGKTATVAIILEKNGAVMEGTVAWD
jgi:hypothetical protein